MYKLAYCHDLPQVDPLRSITFTVTKLEGFVNCDECTVTSEDVGTLRRMTVTDVVSQKPFPPSNCSPPHPGHTITIHPPFTVANLLPFSFHFSFNHKEKLCPRGEEVAIHSVRARDNCLKVIAGVERCYLPPRSS